MHTYTQAHICTFTYICTCTHTRIHAHTYTYACICTLYTDRKTQQRHLNASSNIIDTHTSSNITDTHMYPYTYACTYIYICTYAYVYTLQRVCRRCVRWCQTNTFMTYTPAYALVPRTPVPKCMQHSLQKNAHIYIHSHICIRIHMHTNTHAHPRHCPTRQRLAMETHNLYTSMHTHTYAHVYTCKRTLIHIPMHIYTYIHVRTHTYIHIYTHTHTACTYARMHARLERQCCSDCVRSPTERLEAPPFSLSAAIWRRIPFVASSPIARSRGTTDKRRTTTTNSSSAHHHDSAPTRLHLLICTGAEPIHPIHLLIATDCTCGHRLTKQTETLEFSPFGVISLVMFYPLKYLKVYVILW